MSIPKYKYKLTHSIEGSLELTHSPIGWESKSITFTRSSVYRSVLNSYSLSLQFPFEGADYITNIFDTYGITALIDIEIKELDHSDFSYNVFYDGVLDLKTYRKTRDAVEVAIIDTQVMAKFRARDEIQVQLSQLKTLDDVTITDYTNGVTKDFVVRPVTVTQAASFEGDLLDAFNFTVLPSATTTREVGSSDDGYDYNEIGTGTPSAELPPSEITVSTERRVFSNGSGASLNVGYRFNHDIEFDLDITGIGAGQTWELDIIVYTGISGIGVVAESTYNSGIQTDNGNLTGTLDMSEVSSLGSTIINTGTISFWIDITVTNHDAVRTITATFNDFDVLNQIVQTWINTVGVTETTIEAVLPHEGMERLLKIATNSSLNSEILGRTDSENTSYVADGDASLIGVASGLSLRCFPFDKFPMTTSIKDFFQSFLSMYNIGLWYDKTNSRFEVKTVDNYFKNTNIITLGEVKDFTIEVYNEGYFNEIKAGSKEVSYQDEAIISSFGVPLTLGTNQDMQGILELSMPYRLDDYGIEYARQKPYDEFAGEDTRFDKDIFVIYGERDSGAYRSVRWNVLGFPNPDFTTPIFNGNTRINLDITPKRNLERNGNLIATPGYIDNAKVKFVSSQYNLNLATKKDGEASFTYETDDILYSDLPEPLFYPEIYTFTAPVTQAQISQLMTDPHGYVEFEYLGTTYKGYILEVSTEPYQREGNWTLIKTNPSR